MVLSLTAYVLLTPFGCVAFAVLNLIWRRDPLARTRRMQRLTVTAYRALHDWLRLADILDFDHRQRPSGLPSGPCVVVANHPTLLDITSISAVLGGGCTVVKPALYRLRLLHGLLVGAGHIPGSRTDLVSVGAVVDQALERLAAGFTVIVFPEGTRSPAGELRPFGRAAFEIACRANVPLVSLTVECAPLYLSKEVPMLRPPHPTPRLRLCLLAVDDPVASGRESRDLCRRVEQRYRAWHAGAAPATPIRVQTPEDRQCQMISKTG